VSAALLHNHFFSSTMPLSLKADAARKRRSCKNMNAKQHARKAASEARHRASMTTEQKAHQNALRAQRRIIQRKQATTSHWWSKLSSVKHQPFVQTWLPPCLHCGVQRLASESVDFCCQRGKILAPPLEALPAEIQALVDVNPALVAKLSRKLNNLFCLTVLGVSGGFQHFTGPGPQTVTITGMTFLKIFCAATQVNTVIAAGRTYHRVLPSETPRHALHWFLYDSQDDQNAAGAGQSIPAPLIDAFRNALIKHNPYYRLLGEFHQFHPNQSAFLQLKDHAANGEIGAIMRTTTSSIDVEPRSVYVYRGANTSPKAISILSPQYEPLQYPLLFFNGEEGWHPKNTKKFTQLRWYRARLLQQADRFTTFSRLHCEYICDMYSRVEDQRLDYIRKARNKQLADVQFCRENVPAEDDDGQAPHNELCTATELPASFLGSWRYKRDNTADALALARKRGRPSFFITATANPNWPEVVSQLAPGQSASDAPILMCRIFHARLKALLARLRKIFGHPRYIIRVTEFQKRGIPHAHIIIAVSV
jgi:Helitron helicase-like domain at N-terminus